MPFAGYKDFEECVRKNKDKKDPEAYCGSIKQKVEDKLAPNEMTYEEDMSVGKHQRCLDRLKYLGYTEEEAFLICATVFLEDTKLFGEKSEPTKKVLKAHKFRYDPRTRHTGGHASHVEIGVVPRPMALPIQAPHRPMKSEHIMRTKMEEIQTLEERWLTLEQLAKRAQYQKEIQKTMKGVIGQKKYTVGVKSRTKKQDADFYQLIDTIKNIFTDFTAKDAISFALDNDLISTKTEDIQDSVSEKMEKYIEDGKNYDEAFASTIRDLSPENDIYAVDSLFFDSVNALNNVFKIPVTLAKEMVQSYGKRKDFKPFSELKKAADRIDEVPIIIEHKRFSDNDVIGTVKELRADPKSKTIKGFAYLTESRLPTPLIHKLKAGDRVPVSIGFFANLGEGGEYKGEKYDATQHDININHLAICLRSIARCPVDKCGLNVEDSVEILDGEEMELINKKPYYYNIREEKESKINKNMEEGIMNAENTEDELEDAYIPESHQKIFKKLNDLLNFLPLKEREDAVDYIAELLDRKDEEEGNEKDEENIAPKEKEDSKMNKKEEMADNLEKKIKELEDSLSAKEEEVEEYREKERLQLVDSICEFSQFDKEELEDKCIKELRVIEDAVSRFDPSDSKPRVPKPNKEDSFEDSSKARIKPETIFQEISEQYR